MIGTTRAHGPVPRPRRWHLGLAIALLPQTALALSCLPPDLARDFQQIADSDHSYSVLVGRVAHNEVYWTDEQPYSFAALFEGYGLALDGSDIPMNQRVMVEGQCINGDCGYLSDPDTTQILFARHDGGGLVIEVFPCAATPQPATPEALAIVQSCITGGPCVPVQW